MKTTIFFLSSLCFFACAHETTQANKPPTSEASAAETRKIEMSMTGKLVSNEWKGDCRKLVNENGQVLKGKQKERIQSRYEFAGPNVIWSVLSFDNGSCVKATGGDRWRFTCDNDPLLGKTRCLSTLAESLQSGTWRSAKMTEPMQIDYAAKKNKTSIVLTSTGESEEPTNEELRK